MKLAAPVTALPTSEEQPGRGLGRAGEGKGALFDPPPSAPLVLRRDGRDVLRHHLQELEHVERALPRRDNVR